MEFSQIQTIVPQLQNNTFEDTKKNLLLIKETDHTYSGFGQGLIMKHKNLQIIIFYTTKTFDIEEAFNKSKQEAQRRQQITAPTIVKLITFSFNQHRVFCGAVFKLNLIYECPQQSLEQIILQNRNQKKPFDEQELWFIIDCVISAILTLSKQDIRHGAIQPKNIFLMNQNNLYVYQLTDIRFLNELYEYKMQLLGFSEFCYLSPQLFDSLGKRVINPVYNYEKSEIFSLGLTIAEAALQRDFQIIYDFEKHTVIKDVLEQIVLDISKEYSEQFSETIQAMLQIEDQARVSVQQLSYILNQNMDEKSYSYYLLGDKEKIGIQLKPTTKPLQKPTIKPIEKPVKPSPAEKLPIYKPNEQSISPVKIDRSPYRQRYQNNYRYDNYTQPFEIDIEQVRPVFKHSSSFISPTKYLQKTENKKKRIPKSVEQLNSHLNEQLLEFDDDLRKLQLKFNNILQDADIDKRGRRNEDRGRKNLILDDSVEEFRLTKMYKQFTKESKDDKIYEVKDLRIHSPEYRHDPKFDGEFAGLDRRLQNPELENRVLQMQKEYIKNRNDQFSPIRYIEETSMASLPRSNIIYMHGSKPTYLNDIFRSNI